MCVPGTTEVVRERLEREGAPPIAAPRLSRRATLLAGAGAALAAALPAPAAARSPRRGRGGRRVADLTHLFRDDFPTFPGAPAMARETVFTHAGDGFYAQRWSIYEHAGTHVDAPLHFVAGARSVAQLRARELVAPAVVVDISERAAREPDTAVTPADLLAFERRHGRIPRGAIVCMHSGWEARAGSLEAYRNADADGTMRFPGFDKPAVDWLLARRAITALGVDTLSLDRGSSSTFDVHTTLLGADRYGIENLRGLRALPPRGAVLMVGAIPWQEGSGGPCRVLATWPGARARGGAARGARS